MGGMHRTQKLRIPLLQGDFIIIISHPWAWPRIYLPLLLGLV